MSYVNIMILYCGSRTSRPQSRITSNIHVCFAQVYIICKWRRLRSLIEAISLTTAMHTRGDTSLRHGRSALTKRTSRQTDGRTDIHDLLPAHPVRSRTIVSLMCALFVCLSRWDRRGDGPHLCLRADSGGIEMI